jgi:hypothetical protein
MSRKTQLTAKELSDYFYSRGMCTVCGVIKRTEISLRMCRSCRDDARTNTAIRIADRYSRGVCRLCDSPRFGNGKVCKYHWFCHFGSKRLGSLKHAAFLEALLEKQQWKCHYTGVKLEQGIASVDYILPVSRFPASEKDLSNIVWCTKQTNRIKSNMTEDEFVNICKRVVMHQETKQNEAN